MTDSLRDQLLGLGFKPVKAATRNPEQRNNAKQTRDRVNPAQRASTIVPPPRLAPETERPGRSKLRSREDIDLAKAYAIRAQREKDERIEAERLQQEQARKRREAKGQLAELLKDKALNDPAAEIARHFDYGGKIKRIYVTAAQLVKLNAGALGVVQLDGRYLLIDAALLAQAEALFAPAIALKVDPGVSPADDPYSGPQHQVPDDLVW